MNLNNQMNMHGIPPNCHGGNNHGAKNKYMFSGKEFGMNSDKITLRGNPSNFNRNDLKQIVKKQDESDTVLRKRQYATQNNSQQQQQYKGMAGPRRIDLSFTPSIHSYQRGMSLPPHLKSMHGDYYINK